MKSRFWLFFLIIPVLCVFTGCKEKKEIRTVKIGLIVTLSGDGPPEGEEMKRGAETAVTEINRAGGIGREEGTVKIELIKGDDGGTPEGAVNAARELIFKEEVTAFVGPQFSSNAIPVARLADTSRITMIAPMSTNPKTTENKRFVFRIPFTDGYQASAMARYARKELGFSRIAVLYDISDHYSRGLADRFAAHFENSGGEITVSSSYTADTNDDFTEQLTEIQNSGPDMSGPEALYLPNYAADVEKQVKQARTIGLDCTFLGGDGWNSDTFVEYKAFDGSYHSRHWHPSRANQKAEKVIEKYREKYGRAPEDVFMNTYDAFSVLFQAVGEADEITSEAVRDAIVAAEKFEGVTGTLFYDESGDPEKDVIIVKLADNTVTVAKSVSLR